MKKRLFSIAFMFVLTFFFTSLVTVVKLASEERIEANQRVKLQRIILGVLGIPSAESASADTLMGIFERRVKGIEDKGGTVYVGYGEDGRTISGYAFPVSGSGFWGPVYGMMAVDPTAERVLGLAFYRHSETPGLGARITEAWFTDQFRGLRVQPVEAGHRIFTLKAAGTGQGPNELDAVTGATGTSRAVEDFLNRDLDRFLREIKPNLDRRI